MLRERCEASVTLRRSGKVRAHLFRFSSQTKPFRKLSKIHGSPNKPKIHAKKSAGHILENLFFPKTT